MLTRVVFTLTSKNNSLLPYDAASVLHGVLMENVPGDVAATLHEQGLKPYSQYITRVRDENRWTVCALGEAAFDKIAKPLLDEGFAGFRIRRTDTHYAISNKTVETVSMKDLAAGFYGEDSDRYFRLRFLTPTSFKVGGEYVRYPAIRQIVRSLISKYGAAMEGSGEVDEDMIAKIVDSARIVDYNLRSTRFHLEGVRIPSFIGELTLHVGGSQTLANYFNMLLAFGGFSGVGIKTSLGMGAIKLIGRRDKGTGNDRKEQIGNREPSA
jgi:CRISPR-associated endoribonuclease Cas6